MNKAAIMCSQGVGDALIYSLVGYNLYLKGYRVTLFSDKLLSMQEWFPFQTIQPYFTQDEWSEAINGFDLVIIQPGSLPYPKFRQLPGPLPIHAHYFHSDLLDIKKTYVANLCHLLHERFGISYPTPYNGISPPKAYFPGRSHLRVAIHPTSGEAFRNWPFCKYFKVADKMRSNGYEVAFVMSAQEREAHIRQFGVPPHPLPQVHSLSEMAGFLYESGFFIGNDSGLGHLASCLGVKTVTLFHTPHIAQIWRPGWAPSRVVCPLPLVFKYKWQKKTWKSLLFPYQVLRAVSYSQRVTVSR